MTARMQAVLGTMTFAGQVDTDTTRIIINAFTAAGYNQLDTAYIYCDGATEDLLGRLITPQQRTRIHLATKAHPVDGLAFDAENVELQLETSLRRLNTDHVDLFYLHSPDLNTPIANTLEGCWRLYRAGKFKAFGLSNYAAWQVAEIAELSRHYGWMQPTVYQGMYNALTRSIEPELFPCLRNYDIAFNAYNPLAGGLLSGKHAASDDTHGGGRFALKKNYRERYWAAPYFEAIEGVRKACDRHAISLASAALRWLLHHSRMSADAGDAVVLGASRVKHLAQNLKAMGEGALPDDVVGAFDQGWRKTRPVCMKYFRP